jgi:Zn-dependent protease
MPIGLDVQVHTKVLGALMHWQRSLVGEYPPCFCQLLSILPRRCSLYAYCTHPWKTCQPIVVVTAIRSGSAIGLLHRLLAHAISTIVESWRLPLPVNLLLFLALLLDILMADLGKNNLLLQ